jgi:hypothetical protein
MRSQEYSRNRDIVFQELGIDPSDRRYNCHHMIQKRDKKCGRTNVNINAKENLIPMPIQEHECLHKFIDSHPELRNDVSMRVTIANLFFNGDICDYYDCPIPRPKREKVEPIIIKPNRVESIKIEPISVGGYYIDPLDIDGDIKMRK